MATFRPMPDGSRSGMSKKPRDGAVGPWAREKLDSLGQYLEFYTKALKNQKWWCRATIFIDAFAGPGSSPVRQVGREERELSLFLASTVENDEAAKSFVRGSPRVALDLANPFSHYVFIDADDERVRQLESLRDEYGDNRSIDIVSGDANSEIVAFLSQEIDWNSRRGVCFLDPWGLQVSWATIERLARTDAMEVLINFPLMGIQRLLKRTGDLSDGWKKSLDTFFGSEEWRDYAYHEEDTLFGPETQKLSDSGVRLLNWYRRRLQAVFGHVSHARLIKNTRGGHLYYLVWAGPHKLGLKGANHILSKGEVVRLSTK